jgi:hypothetical protein
MPKNDVWFEVHISFLKEVFYRLRFMDKQVRESYKPGHIPAKTREILENFHRHHPLDGKAGKFYREYFRTNLIHRIEEREGMSEEEKERGRGKVMMFGFLRTFFLGILHGRPKTNVFTRRVEKYKQTHELAKSLEDFIKLYRRRVGFQITKLSRKTLRSSGKISQCVGLPESMCAEPICVFIRPEDPTRPGFCKRAIKTLKRSRKEDDGEDDGSDDETAYGQE